MRGLPVLTGAEKEKTGHGTAIENAGLSGHYDPCDRDHLCDLYDLLWRADAEEHLPDADIHTGILYLSGAE